MSKKEGQCPNCLIILSIKFLENFKTKKMEMFSICPQCNFTEKTNQKKYN